jgi:hypothetical protein
MFVICIFFKFCYFWAGFNNLILRESKSLMNILLICAFFFVLVFISHH